MEEFTTQIIDICTSAGSKLILALLIWLIGKAVVGKLMKMLANGKAMANMDPTAKGLILSAARLVLTAVLLLSVVSVLGVPMSSVVALLATFGLAIGMAMQGALGNLAGGIMLLIFRPFKSGDIINAAGGEGVVEEITMFYTKLKTPDNIVITIPNGSLMGSNVTNYSAGGKRRLDAVFSVGKDTDIDKAEEIIRSVLKETEGVLPDEDQVAAVAGGTNEALELLARCWVIPSDYAPVKARITEGVTRAFGKAGFKAPAVRIISEK